MTSWAARMHRRAATFSNVVTSCGHPSGPYPRRLEKVKFGVPLEEVCKNDIPGPLLVLILKLNKEAPFRKDVFRAPGHQGAMKKLIHFLQTGRLVNMDNFSVYTIASVLKKFLRKIPGGVFGRNIEQQLFQIIEMSDVQEQRDEIHRIIMSLPVYTQRLLVLLFGTFRVIASNSERAGTGMSSEALGVSVAPSFFQSCVSDGKTAKMEDVLRFKVATRVMKHLIEEFASSDLFGRDNYEFYARVTGRVLRVQGEWICSFQYPPPPPRGNSAQQLYASGSVISFVEPVVAYVGPTNDIGRVTRCEQVCGEHEEFIVSATSARKTNSSHANQERMVPIADGRMHELRRQPSQRCLGGDHQGTTQALLVRHHSGRRWSVDERRVDTETSEYPSFKQSRQAILPAPVEQPAQQGERFPFRQLQNQEGLHITLQQLQGSRHSFRHRSPELNTIPIQ